MSRNVEEAKKEEDLEDPRGAKDVKDHDKEEEGSDEEDADETSDKPPTSMRRMAKQPTKPR